MSVKYRLSINGLDTGGSMHDFSGPNSDSAGGGIGQGDGWTDALAIEIASAFKAITWPENMSWSLAKIDTSVTETDLDVSTNPPSFH